MGRLRSTANLGGGVMVSLAAIAASFYYEDWAHAHSQMTFRIMVVSGLCAVLCYSFLIFTKNPSSKSFAAKLQIQERCVSPCLDRLKPGIGHIFLLADVELLDPKSAEVVYSLDLIKDGITYPAEWIRDVEEWRVLDHGEDRGPACPLAVDLVRGGRIDGWLHFKVDTIGETELRGCTHRLWVKTKRDSDHCQYQGNAWPMPRKDLAMRRDKKIPTRRAKSSTTCSPRPQLLR